MGTMSLASRLSAQLLCPVPCLLTASRHSLSLFRFSLSHSVPYTHSILAVTPSSTEIPLPPWLRPTHLQAERYDSAISTIQYQPIRPPPIPMAIHMAERPTEGHTSHHQHRHPAVRLHVSLPGHCREPAPSCTSASYTRATARQQATNPTPMHASRIQPRRLFLDCFCVIRQLHGIYFSTTCAEKQAADDGMYSRLDDSRPLLMVRRAHPTRGSTGLAGLAHGLHNSQPSIE
jgi:hypothetical protein